MITTPPNDRSISSPNPARNGAARKPQRPRSKDEDIRDITPLALWHAFRRRWKSAVLLAIPAAAIVAAVVWQVIPAPYESYATVKVSQFQPKLINKEPGGYESNFLNYRDSQMAYMKSRPVLEATLRKPEVARTKMISGMKHPLEYLAREVKVASMESDEFVRLSLQGDNPEELTTIVNAIKDAYMNEVVFGERNRKAKQLKQVQTLLAEKKTNLRTLEANIDELAKGLGVSDARAMTVKLKMLEGDLTDLRKDLRQVKDALSEEERRRNARIRAGLPADTLVAVDAPVGGVTPYSTSTLGPEARRAIQLRVLIARMKSSLAAGHTNDSLERAKAELASLQLGGEEGPGAVMSQYQVLLDRKMKLDEQIAATQDRYEDNSRKATQLARENREVETLAADVRDFQSQITGLSTQLKAPTRVEVVHAADVPQVRQTKTRSRLAVLGSLGIFGVVIGVLTMLEWMSHRIADCSELTVEASLKVLGSLPAPEKTGLLGSFGVGRTDMRKWNRAMVESVDGVRTFLLSNLNGKIPQCITVASASANEGKTTLATQLGSSVARSGRRVCVVDCDFRSPSAHEAFQMQPGAGVSELLRGQADLDSVVQQTSTPGLSFLSAGAVDCECLRILALDGGEHLIATLKQRFDVVIVDTSPLLFVAEPSMIAQHSDGVVMAVRRDFSRMSFVKQACETLRNLEAPLIGSVMLGAESTIQRQTYGYQKNVDIADSKPTPLAATAG